MYKKIIIVIGIIILILVFFMTYGWRLFGFTFCTGPSHVVVVVEEITDDEVILKFDTTYSDLDFKGATYRIKDRVLYVGAVYGVKWIGKPSSYGELTVPIDENIEKIIIKGGTQEYEIYTQE